MQITAEIPTLQGKMPRVLSNVRSDLRRCVPNKGLYPLRRFAAVHIVQKA